MKKLEINVKTNVDRDTKIAQNNRRIFLKKAAYSAPILLVLGQLSQPTKAEADSGPPVGPPSWGGF